MWWRHALAWTGKARFTYIDVAGWIIAVDLVRGGFWFTALSVMFVAMATSTIVSALWPSR